MKRQINRIIPRLAAGAKAYTGKERGFQGRLQEVERVTKVGYDVSDVFPWYRSGLSTGSAPYSLLPNITTPIIASNSFFGGMGEEAFKNDTDGNIEIQRLAFSHYLVPASSGDALSRISVKMEGEVEDIIKKWVPITTLHTDPNHYLHGELNQGTWVLPTPYFLQAQHVFTGALFTQQSTTLQGKTLTLSLRGYNPVDLDPIVMTTTVTFAASVAQFRFNPFSFTENRDGPLRDMVVEEITVGLSDIYDELNTGNFLQQLFIRFDPPDGPKWSQDVLVAMANLSTQMNVTNSAGNYFPLVIFEPVRPYVLEPGQSLKIWIRAQEQFASGLFGVTAVGIQRGRRAI